MLEESSQPRPQMENQFSSMCSESWKAWVTEQRQEYSQRVKSERLTRESESSSLAWPTASVAGCVEGGVAKNVEMTSSGFKATRENGTSYGAKLRDAVETYEKKNWATPQTFDSNNIVRTPEKLAQTRAEKNAGCMNLREQVHYPDMDHSRKGAKALSGLLDQASDSTTGKRQGSQQWATPRANKVHPKITEENRDHLANRGKSNLEEDIAGHCGTAQGKLNPDWVEHLMGLPAGWTDLGSWETE
tara:strand:- start:2049 stop:2783 length:735 start_codon:yes stop_codon:yes gene_type:complete